MQGPALPGLWPGLQCYPKASLDYQLNCPDFLIKQPLNVEAVGVWIAWNPACTSFLAGLETDGTQKASVVKTSADQEHL